MNLPTIPQGVLDQFAADAANPADRLAKWLQGLGPNTRKAYQCDLTSFARYLGLKTAGEAITAMCQAEKRVALASVESFRQARIDAGMSSAAVNRPVSVIKSALRHLARADFGPGVLDVGGVKTERVHDNRGPTPDELSETLGKLQRDPSDKALRNYLIVLLIAERALRRSEICALQISDFSPERGEILVKRKGRAQKVPAQLSTNCQAAMVRWIKRRGDIAQPDVTALFVSVGGGGDTAGRPLTAKGLYKAVHKLGQGRAWRPHGLRHASITETLRRTNNLEAARVLAGHAKVSTTQQYLDDNAGMEALAVKAMDGAFSKK